jgi:hypothetical protein
MDIYVRHATHYISLNSVKTYTLNQAHPSYPPHASSPKVRSEIHFNLVVGMYTKLWPLNTFLVHTRLM